MKLLNIETATELCSISVSDNTEIITLKESNAPFSHTAKLTLLIEQGLQEAGIKLNALDAISLSSGPGSYTALRVGTSVAKGLCYALNKPLLAVDTLKSLALAAKMHINDPEALYCPMIDARRMEVYTALYDANMQQIETTHALIVEQDAFKKYLQNGKSIIFAGNGAMKCAEILGVPNTQFLDIPCSAKHTAILAAQAWQTKQFEDVAYFSPNYLKAPNITTPKKRL